MFQNQYECDTCGQTFETQAELNDHKRMTHSQYQCEECGQYFSTQNELEKHQRTMHPLEEREPHR